MDIKLLTIQRELSLLSVFRGLKNTPLIAALEELLSAIEEGSKSGQGNDSGMTDCKKNSRKLRSFLQLYLPNGRKPQLRAERSRTQR